jgi:hypothetical protein
MRMEKDTSAKSSDKPGETQFNLKDWQNGGITHWSQTCFAEYWDKVQTRIPSLSHPTSSQSTPTVTVTLDPYNFDDRMELSKYLIQNTGSTEVWGEGYTKHWYWAYLSQLDWQWRSGRYESLKNLTQGDDTMERSYKPNYKMDSDSWIAKMNIGFTVAVYEGAVRAGLVPKVQLSSDVVDCQDLVKEKGFQQIVEFWESVWTGPHGRFVDLATTGGLSQSSMEQAELDLARCVWAAHTKVIKTSLVHAQSKLTLQSPIEQDFLLGFCRMVELLDAMSSTALSLDALMKYGAGYLPSRVLRDEESLMWLKNNRFEEYKVTTTIMSLSHASTTQMSLVCLFFQRLSTWEYERKNIPLTMHILNFDNSISRKCITFLRIVVKVLCPQCIKRLVTKSILNEH